MSENLYIKKKNRRLREQTNILPKAFFVLMAILGSALVWFLKYYQAHPLLIVAVPVSFIFIYCGLAWRAKDFYVREDQIGDNAYYLGFLYTLSSLAYALLKFQMDRAGDPADIIGSFGVALWSTIVGIALRVFFSQLRQDPEDIERDARVKIAQTASVLASDLQQAAATFNAYTRGLQQAIDEVFMQAKEMADKNIASLEQLNKRIEATEAPGSLITKKFEGIFSDLESSIVKLNSLASTQTKSLENLSTASDRFMNDVQELGTQIKTLQGGVSVIEAGNENVRKISDIVQNVHVSMAGLSESFVSLHDKQAHAVKSITNHANEMEKQLDRSRKYTEQTHESLVSMTQTLAEKL